MRRKNVLVCLAVLAVLIAPAISAPAISAQESNTLKASYGIFGTDVDDYMDVNNWKGVSESFDKGFGFVGGGRDAAAAPNAGGFQGGYATKLGGLYLGLFLDGQVWKGQGTDVFDDENKRQDTTDTGRLFVDGYYGVLLGGGFGGAKLFVDFDNTSHNYDFTDATTSTVINYSGNLTIGAAYGMITEGGLKPEVGVSYNIALNDYSDTDGDIVDIPTAADILNVYFTSNIPLKDENAWAGAKYKLDLGLHRPERDDPNDTKTTYLPTEWGNTLSGWYGKSWDIGERISVGFEFDLDLGVQLAQEVKTVGDADPAYGPMNTAFYIAPQAEVAVKYNFAKKPFSLIVGMQYAAHTVSDPYTDDVFWRVTRAEGRDTDNKSTGATVTYDFNPLDIQFSLGGSWNPVPQFSVDATVTQLWFLKTPNSEFNFTGNAGITNVPLNFNLLFTLKI